jgi:hypothetical protein
MNVYNNRKNERVIVACMGVIKEQINVIRQWGLPYQWFF